MDPDPWLPITLGTALFFIAGIAVLSTLEAAVATARRSRMAAYRPDPRVEAAEALIDAPEKFRTSVRLARSLAEALVFGAASVAGLLLALPFSSDAPLASPGEALMRASPGALLGALVACALLAIAGQVLPRRLASARAERLLLRSVGMIRLFTLASTPALWASRRLARLLLLPSHAESLAARATHSEEEIRLLVEDSAEEGVLEEEEKEMIHSIFEFGDTLARQIMVPRIDVRAVDVESSLDGVVQHVLESGHSRLPVYEGTLDTVVGVIHVKDLLPYLVSGDRSVSIRQVLREPYFVPEGKKIDEMLHEFRSHRSRLAVVVDEFGGTSGIVTVEDVLEEIVGEIEDEYDKEEHPAALVEPTGEGVLVDARMLIGDVNEQLGLELPPGDYETLGGFVFSLFGRPPEVGERVTADGLEFVAEAMEGLRLLKIRVLTRERPGA